jgi:hypothetical protein
MGHDVKYNGSLKLKQPLTEEQEARLKELQEDSDNYAKLYAVEYDFKFKNRLYINDEYEKLDPEIFFKSLEKYLTEAKVEVEETWDNCILSCSAYGINDEEALVFFKKDGKYHTKCIVDVVGKFIRDYKEEEEEEEE